VVIIQQFNFPGAEPLSVLAAVLTCGLLTLLGFSPFKRFFEHSVLGMPLAPEGLVHAYAGRITTSLEQEALRRLLLEEVLPSLLVREFAQLELRGAVLETAFGLRSEAGSWALPEQAALERAAGQEVVAGAAGSGLPGWVRLVLPLRAAQETRGYWLLGRRDPDDRYPQEDIVTLQALADQTALALINIRQAEALRALYIADVERGENERLAMAAELHDDVLNQLAVLNMSLQEAAPVTLQAYDQAVFHIRQIINGLRPAMLQYGLCAALETLTDELNDRFAAQGGPRIVLELPRTEARFEQRVELGLFRIAQQACANAIQHAQCRVIRIAGAVTEDGVELVVSDDGRGFPAGGRIDLPVLLAGKHFGLAGMFERAAAIGARLQVNSQPGQGSRVELSWKKS
jgi:signal transduction histidine kinase